MSSELRMSIREHLKTVGIMALVMVTVTIVLYLTPPLLLAVGTVGHDDPEGAAPRSLCLPYAVVLAPTGVLAGIWTVIIVRGRNST
jgi:hypothetical protein